MEDLNVIDLLVDAIKMHKKVSKHSLNLLCQIIMLVYFTLLVEYSLKGFDGAKCTSDVPCR